MKDSSSSKQSINPEEDDELNQDGSSRDGGDKRESVSEANDVEPRQTPRRLSFDAIYQSKEKSSEDLRREDDKHKDAVKMAHLASQKAGNSIKTSAKGFYELQKKKPAARNLFSRRDVKKSVANEETRLIPGDRISGIDDVSESEINISKFSSVGLSSMTEHCLPIAEICRIHDTHIDLKSPLASKGLSKADYECRLKEYGPNINTLPKKTSTYLKFMECLSNLFNVLLFAGGALYLFLYSIQPTNNFESIWIGCTLFLVGFINAGVEFYELEKIAGILRSFKTMIFIQSIVIRDGVRITINSTDLVPGDIIQIRTGDKIPADCILFQAVDMKVDGSSLTGESEPFQRMAKHSGSPADTDPFDCPHVLFSSDVIITGDGFAIVVQTGKHSSLGKINRAANALRPRVSSLTLEIRRFCKSISILAMITAFVFFFVALARGRNFTYAATFGIGILIAWVPQGLPLTVTMILAISARKMTEEKILVKDLHGLETLGSITMLATDKTGTLTRNEMHVIDIWLNGSMWYAGAPGNMSKDQKLLKIDVSGVAQLMHVCVTCSKAKYDRLDVTLDKRTVIGDATEAGLLRFAGNRLNNIERLPELYPKIFEVPFSSETKVHITIHRKSHVNGGITLHAKGAPEFIWKLCSNIWIDGKIVPIDDEWSRKFIDSQTLLAKKGSRMIGCCILQLLGNKYPDNFIFNTEKQNYPQSGYTFLGMLGLEDPPKDEVNETIKRIRSAGIKTVMITGDNCLTAETISRKVSLVTSDDVQRIDDEGQLPIQTPINGQAIVLNGKVIKFLNDLDWLNVLNYDEIIFARTLPSHKLEIVRRAQSLGHIVAVTGDGVNDSSALKRADLGIAMNQSGSDISKESARMILLDDNFASTVKGIQEEVLPYFLYVVVPLPLAITPTQMLMIDLGFEILLTLSFSWEPAEDEKKLMSVPPRKNVTTASTLATYTINKNREAVKASRINIAEGSRNEMNGSTMLLNGDDDVDHHEDIKTLGNRLNKRYVTYFKEIRTIFTDKNYWIAQRDEWRLITANPSGERLVDGEVMLWAFLEAGIIEFSGALCTYFAICWFGFGLTADDARRGQIQGNLYWKPHSPHLLLDSGDVLSGPDQFEAIKQIQSGYFLSIFIIQVFNLFACKTRYTVPIGRRILSNAHTWKSIGAGIVVVALVVYTPPTNALFLTSLYLSPIYLLIPLSFGSFLYLYSIIRRLILQRFNPIEYIRQRGFIHEQIV